MTRFTCSRYPSLRVHRGDDTYIEFTNGETFADYRDSSILRGLDNVIEAGVALDKAGAPLKEYPLDPDVVSWYSLVLGVGDGYGNSAERMIAAVERAGQRISVDGNVPVSGETTIKDVLDRSYVHGAVRIVYCPPGPKWDRRYPNQRTLGFSMWEDSELPNIWDRYLTAVDAIAVPSRFCEAMFRKRLESLGSSIPVVVVPLGVETGFFGYRRRQYTPGTPFIFQCSATSLWDGRKGIREIVDAFRAAFPDNPHVRLVCRARIGELETHGDSRIDVRVKMMTEAEKRDALYEGHAYVCASKGEGFGLMALEAIATGLPTICAANSGMLDYQDLYTPVVCDSEPSKIAIVGYNSIGRWCPPQHEGIVKAMRAMVADYPKHVQLAARASKAVKAQWGYDRTATALIEAVKVARGETQKNRLTHVVGAGSLLMSTRDANR